MNEPIATLDLQNSPPGALVTPWEETRRVLDTADLFWLSTVRADGHPHVTPLVAVWHDEAIHFTAKETAQKTANLRGNPHVILTTGYNQILGLSVVVEGDAVRITDQDTLERLASVWATKWDGESWLYQVRTTPRRMMLERGAHSNWAKKLVSSPRLREGLLPFLGMGADCRERRAR